MKKRHRLLVASQWNQYCTQIWIECFAAQSMTCNQDFFWGYILCRLGSRCESSNNHHSILWRMNDHEKEASLACGFPIKPIFGSYALPHSSLHAVTIYFEATFYAAWDIGVEQAIIIIVYSDVWMIMEKKYHLLLASQWISYCTQIWIVCFSAQFITRYHDCFWGYILRRLSYRCGASNNHHSIFWRMNDHEKEASLASGFPMDLLLHSNLDRMLCRTVNDMQSRLFVRLHSMPPEI
jgi:hypothetical protein